MLFRSMKIIKYYFGFIAVLFLSGCMTIQKCGTFTGNASLSNNNFRIVEIARGTAQNTFLPGFGGFNNKGLVAAAKRNLYTSYKLKHQNNPEQFLLLRRLSGLPRLSKVILFSILIFMIA